MEVGDAMPTMRRGDAGRGVELYVLPGQPVLGAPAFRRTGPYPGAAGLEDPREHASVPGPGVWTMLAAPVAVFPVMPAVDETVQLTKVEPVVRMVPAD